MFNVEKLTDSITEKVSSELSLDANRKEVIAYGIFALLHMALSITLVVILGLAFGVLVEALIILFTGSILRKYSGGVHAGSPGACAAIGTTLSIGLALLISFVMTSFINLKLIIFLGLTAFIYSYYIILKLAPVDSTAKPIKTQKKKDRMKKGSILILNSYAVIIVFNIILYLLNHEEKFLVFSLCIYGGTAWQAFTLTSVGHLAFKKIDIFLNKISAFIRRIK